jgi:short-subunit dehydrogenase
MQGPEDLAGKQVIVTGASSGIGAAVARHLAGLGASLTLLGRDRTRLSQVARGCAGASAIRLLSSDFGRPGSVARLARQLRAQRAGLRAMIHAAGEYSGASLAQESGIDFKRLMQVNAQAGIALSLALRSRLAGMGDVVFINSSITQRPALHAAFYSASKHALLALTDSLREEFNSSGIRVTSIFPGRTASPMQQALARADRAAYDPGRLIQPADIAQLVASVLLTPRTAEITDIYLRPSKPPRG